MFNSFFSLLANHLWQSTLFAGIIGLLTLALRRNSARIRYWLWMAASVKFLIPFSLFVAIGGLIGQRSVSATLQPSMNVVVEEITQTLTPIAPSAPLRSSATPSASPVLALLLGIWTLGSLCVAASWWLRWRRVRAAVRVGSSVQLGTPVPAISSPALLEPGVFGIAKPILLLPQGITEHLTPEQLEAIIAHELCHVRRRDNLTASVHMLVEAIFWFDPLAWWIRTRLAQEREAACDEEVVRMGTQPRVYAQGILKVCELYLESPVACVSGVSGSNLRRRIEGIMSNRLVSKVSGRKKVLLASAGLFVISVPVAVGIVSALFAQAQQPSSKPAFEVASVRMVQREKLNGPPELRYTPQGVDFSNVPLGWVIGEAYGIGAYDRISASDGRIMDMFFSPAGTAYFLDISAKAAQPVPKEQIRLMLQTLLAVRFSLVAHREPKMRPVYKLVAGKSGPKFKEAEAKVEPMCSFGLEGFVCRNVGMARFAGMLSPYMDRPVLDSTGLTASYDFTLSLQGGQVGGKAMLVEWFSSSIFSDIERQLGLRLDADKGTVEYLVIDHAEKPSEN